MHCSSPEDAGCMARYSGRIDELSTLRKAKTEANVEIVANCDGVDCACVGVCVGVGVDLPFPLMEGMAGADKSLVALHPCPATLPPHPQLVVLVTVVLWHHQEGALAWNRMDPPLWSVFRSFEAKKLLHHRHTHHCFRCRSN